MATAESDRLRAVYTYLRPLLEGRRVLEVTARNQSALGAAGPYDVLMFPDAAVLLEAAGGLSVAQARGLLGPQGWLVCVAKNGDKNGDRDGGGVGYYDLLDALAPHFASVRMFGQTPFVAFGLAEFDETPGALRVDSALVDTDAEQPTHYLALAGPQERLALGYALVQVPVEASAQAAASARAEVPADVAALRRELAEAMGRAEGALRVSRAQAEEIEELRARLRRAGEARAELDDELARVRRQLAKVDESMVSLTRRTTEEMTMLAHKLTAGLRAPAQDAHGGRQPERLRALEAALAERESLVSERDERIAVLEGDKQDLLWRLAAAEESAALPDARGRTPDDRDDLLAALTAKDRALEDYRRAAQSHVDEVVRLSEALADSGTLVAELEEALAEAERRRAAAEQEAERLRALAASNEEADRQRRTRLAELEGTLLRKTRLEEADRLGA